VNDRSPYLHGTNLVLLIATVLIAAAASVIALGPAAQRRAALQQIHAATHDEFDRWQRDFQSYRPISADEREQWEQSFRAAEQWIPIADSEPQIIAAVARVFEGGSVRGLDLQPGETRRNPEAENDEEAAADSLALVSADGDRHLRLRKVPLRVHFQASYPDIARILEKLESQAAPLQVESLKVERGGAELSLDAELVFVLRSARDAG
jgi:hypothetical protein